REAVRVRCSDQVARAVVGISLERDPAALGGRVLRLDRRDLPGLAGDNADDPTGAVLHLNKPLGGLLVGQCDPVAIAILDGGEANPLPTLLDEGEHAAHAVSCIDNKPPGLAAEGPAPFADAPLSNRDLREYHLRALIGPDRDGAAADLD